MAKNSVDDWDTVAANNTDVGGINLAEGTATVDDMNDAFREVMAQSKSAFQARLSASNNLSDVASASTARTNLGLAWELIADESFSAVSTYEKTGLGDYRQLRISITAAPSVAAGLGLRLSTDNGATWKSGASDYRRTGSSAVDGGSLTLVSGANDYYYVNTVQNQVAGEAIAGWLDLISASGSRPNLSARAIHVGSAASAVIASSTAGNCAFLGVVSGIQFSMPSATMTGRITIEGART